VAPEMKEVLNYSNRDFAKRYTYALNTRIQKGVIKMGNQSTKEQQQSQLAMFIKEVRENFQAAGKAKTNWFVRIIKKIFK
jgi:hypothetical protein